MSNYRNIEINLLPPELMPPPTVRTAVILNFAIVLGVLAYMAVATFGIFNEIRSQQEQKADLQKQVEAKKDVEEMYADLQKHEESVNQYGRLVSLASVDYIDAPVLLDRLAKIIPAGVYLNRISNDKSSPNAKATVVQVELMTTKQDPALMQATLDAFKNDSIFHDCFMANAEIHKESITDNLADYGINWHASGPNISASIDVNKYQFAIMASVPKLVDTSGLPVSSDQSIYLADVPFKTPPPEDENKGKPGKAGAAAAPREPGTKEPEHGSDNAPTGVKPVGTN